MVTYFETVKFEHLPVYSTKASDLKNAINRSEEKSFIWNLVENGFYENLPDDCEMLTAATGETAFPLSLIDTYMSYSAREQIEDNGYSLIDGRFVLNYE